MAGGKPEEPDEQRAHWQADSNAGTLQGWGLGAHVAASTPAQAATAATAAAASAQPLPSAGGYGTAAASYHRAEDLFSDLAPQTGADAGAPAPATEALPDTESDEDVAPIDPRQLQALLCDNAAFFEACEEAILAASGQNDRVGCQLQRVDTFQKAMNHICSRCGIEEVDREEARDLWDGPMDSGVFYQFAREYFSSLCRTLTMDMSMIAGEDCA
mmetsp:Transcript_96128/g.170589  ORF Transcript_96128/g.170589 Transcript_96128/m.170589 type:complete len:215 (-) Transcript_96128:90-734(-)